jgi:uncharacterized membrane protein HdeD (DUF308 family)
MTELYEDGRFRSGYAIHGKWGWFLALGILLVVLGIVAFVNVVAATLASIFFIAAAMLVAGVGHVVHAFQVRGWENMLSWGLSGALYLAAGVFAFINPILASAVMTLLMAFALLVAGLFRLFVGFRLLKRGGGFMIFGGLVSVAAGVMIAMGWPESSLWVLGLFLSIDMMIQGSTLTALALALRRLSGRPGMPT